MARHISYKYKGEWKKIPFSYDKYADSFEAVAAAEGIDLTAFRKMEQQVAMTAKGKGALKDYRKNAFVNIGFSEILLLRDDQEPFNL
jgi:hypothetical protein